MSGYALKAAEIEEMNVQLSEGRIRGLETENNNGITINQKPYLPASLTLHMGSTACSTSTQIGLTSRNTLICKSNWFCERLTWNPAESPVFDVSRQLNVLHQAASCSSC
ncbi:hypothetical protein CSKR_111541 [Clonorchis sinensis]|uniref:Uncharacterized protein n=1 Tax=Clonorchis sinensis TaxID=79923 RepID=A0A3R7FW68_CLOSI|nr:hypothetical protein CSKR_111541 [Clonorchis sinensis]